MSSPADILAAYLTAAGLGSQGAWPITVGYMPDGGNNAICVYDTEGFADGRLHVTGLTVTHPGMQVRVRSAAYNTGYAKAQAIAVALDAVRNTIVGNAVINAASRTTGGIVSLGQEQGGRRHLFTLNAVVTLAG